MDGGAEMKYLAKVNEQPFHVVVEDDGRVRIDDQAFAVDLKAIDGQALFSLLVDHESYEMVAEEHQDGYRVLLLGEMYQVAVKDTLRQRMKAKDSVVAVSPDQTCVVRAPMPGLVVQVPVSVGQEVSAGEVLVILESMKMENELLSPRQGTVKAIHVSAGDTPALDEPLLTLA